MSPATPRHESPASGPDRIAVVRLSSLGDVVMAMPAVEGLRRAHPRARISWVVERRARNVLEGWSSVDEIIEFPRDAWQALWKRPLGYARSIPHIWRFMRSLRRRRFDLSIDFQGNLKSGIVTWMAGAPVRIGYEPAECREPNWLFTNRKLRVGGQQMHRMDRDLLLAGLAGVPFRFVPPVPGFDPQDREVGERVLPGPGEDPPAVVFHPGTSTFMPHKRWPLEHYAAVGEALHREAGARLLLSWGPGEQGTVQSLAELMHAPAEILPPTPTVKSLGYLLSRSDLVLGGDTGPVHLAVLLGIPTLVVLGPGDPRTYYPHGHPERVFYRRMPCSPCRHRACGQLTCLGDVEPDPVIATGLEILAMRKQRRGGHQPDPE